MANHALAVMCYIHFVNYPVLKINPSGSAVCDRSFAGTACSNPVGVTDLSLVKAVCYQIDVSATGRSLV